MSKTTRYIKASRKGSREAENDSEYGWKTKHKIHKSDKTYSRKRKYNNFDEL